VHTLVRRFIKTGVAFLFLGLLTGLWMLVRREVFGAFPDPYTVSAHTHAVFVGFVLFLILGVALWLFPRAPKDDTRYRPGRAAAAYWILLASTLARYLGEMIQANLGRSRAAGWVVVAAGVGQLLGLAVYFWTMWPRIRPVGSHLREARGERF
jgi:heme/copper-type cytochrome/quinol oxidase subunit 1